ncbi:MAG TPA: bifunctional riboflavin kinase/FAD synthetase [bacterium]
MEVFRDLSGVRKDRECVLTVGTFDGVHRGHQFIIAELKKRAQAGGLRTTLVTFEPHPQLVLKSSAKPALQILTTIAEKLQILEQLNLDRVVVIEFTREFASTSSQDFVRRILFESIGFQEIVIGHDHAFGKNREGDIATLRQLAAEIGFRVDELPAFTIDDGVISSTAIRNLLHDGRVQEANRYLGQNYSLSATVIKGEGRGKRLNFPTANLKPDAESKLIPGDGVYAVHLKIAERLFKGMMNIGVRPTFGEMKHTIEVHIFNFDDAIYGKHLTVYFVDKIRDEMRFAGPAELIKQLEEDKTKSLKILQN